MDYRTQAAIIEALRRRIARFAFERGGLLAVVALVAYGWLAPAHIVDGDNAEFATLGAVGGIAHPSGYPLYVVWLRALSWLPGSPAHAAAIATAILGAAQLVVLHAACRAWGARATAATIAVAIYGAAPVVLRIHTEAEVFAGNGLVVATVLWLAASAGPVRATWRCAALGLVAGLGLANHLTCALIAPVGLLGLGRGIREASVRPAAIAAAAGALVLGLTPYLYLFVAPRAASWGEVTTFGDLIDVVLRTSYGGAGAFASHGDPVPAATSLGALLMTLGRTWLYLPGLLGLGVLGWRTATAGDGRGEPRAGWGLLAVAFVLAGPVLATRFNVPPEGLGLYVVQRFHLLAALLLGIPVAAGVDLVGARLGPRLRRLGAPVAGAVTAVGFVALTAASLPQLSRVHSPAVERGIVNLLGSLPPNAVVIGVADDYLFGVRYAQLALGARRDVTYVNWPLVSLRWYRARLAEQGVPIAASEGTVSVAVAEAALAHGRPVFVDHGMANILAALPHYPYGLVERVVPRGSRLPSLGEIVETNRALYAAFDLDYPRPGPNDEWATEVHLRYADTWFAIAQAFRAAGDPVNAAAAADIARQVGPQ